MRILISGVDGFIGRAVRDTLLARGHEVCGLVRAGQPADWQGPLLAADLAELADGALAARFGALDAVLHLAGRAHRVGAAAEAEEAFRRDNLLATQRLAQAAATAGASHFVFVSSIAVHDEHAAAREPLTADSPVAPRSAYGRSKAAAEDWLQQAWVQPGHTLTVLRPALVVGPGAPGNLARLAGLVARGLPLPVPRQDNRRAFVGLHNLSALLEQLLTDTAAAGQVLVAAEAQPVSTRQLIGWIAAGLGRKPWLPRVPGRLLGGAAALAGQAAAYEKLYGDLLVDASATCARLGWVREHPLAEEFTALGRALRAS